MMLMLVLVVVTCVASGFPTQPGCCTPAKWEGIKYGMKGQIQAGLHKFEQKQVYISYDEISSKICYTISMTLNGQTQNTKKIFNYDKGVLYDIDLNIKTCKQQVITTVFGQYCLPDDAKQEGSKFYYGVGNITVSALSFSKPYDKLNITSIMTADNCLTVAQVTIFKDPIEFSMESINFMNYTLGIKDPSVFTPPKYCKKQHI